MKSNRKRTCRHGIAILCVSGLIACPVWAQSLADLRNKALRTIANFDGTWNGTLQLAEVIGPESTVSGCPSYDHFYPGDSLPLSAAVDTSDAWVGDFDGLQVVASINDVKYSGLAAPPQPEFGQPQSLLDLSTYNYSPNPLFSTPQQNCFVSNLLRLAPDGSAHFIVSLLCDAVTLPGIGLQPYDPAGGGGVGCSFAEYQGVMTHTPSVAAKKALKILKRKANRNDRRDKKRRVST